MRASRDTERSCDAAFVVPWKARAAGVSRECGGLGEASRGGGRSVVCVRPVALRPTIYAFGVTLEVRAVGA